ncbi:MAG: alpha/beta fold hydrolase [Betaproteobacteria bacterium]|nr:alpha/beta fold hydrolase [Betaproteobacteria bacterium]
MTVSRTKRGGWRLGAALALAAAVALGAAGCASLDTRERELVFRPVREYVRTPADLGIDYQDLWIGVAREGGGTERVHAWWLPAARPDAPAILYLHGVRWSLGNNLTRIARWHQLGFAVLAIDYRGFGRSDGDLPSESQIYADARAAWAELERREPNRDRRFIYGHSLGAAVAIDLASRVDGAAGVIAEAGFTSLADVVAETNGALALLVTQRFNALERAKSLRSPVLFMHGTADRLVPPAMSERLYQAAPQPKRLHWIEGANHGNWNGAGLDEYRRVVLEFVGSARTLALSGGS